VRPRHGRRNTTAHGPMFALAGLILVAAIFAAAIGLNRFDSTVPAAVGDRLDGLAMALGLGLDQVEVSGHRHAGDADILDALDLANVATLLRFDDAAVRARIERLPWIATATLERLWPNRLRIVLTERVPLAVWDRGPRDVLVDATGRQLATVTRGAIIDLPRIAGEGAADDAARLLGLIAGRPEIGERLISAERIAGRRWRLNLRGGLRIELPAGADAAALAMLVEPRPGGRLLDVTAEVIDMTVLRRITLRGLSPARRS
jgi:cell division protein FtsQ